MAWCDTSTSEGSVSAVGVQFLITQSTKQGVNTLREWLQSVADQPIVEG